MPPIFGECVNCYDFKMSPDNKLYFNITNSNSMIYAIDETKLTMTPVATVTDKNWRISSVYSQWATLQSGEQESLINLKDGKSYLTSHQITFIDRYNSSTTSQSPFVNVGKGVQLDAKTVISEFALIDLNNLSSASVYTSSTFNRICDPTSVDCVIDGGMHGGDDGEGDYSVLPTTPITPLTGQVLAIQHPPMEVITTDPPDIVYLSPSSENSFTLVIKTK